MARESNFHVWITNVEAGRKTMFLCKRYSSMCASCIFISQSQNSVSRPVLILAALTGGFLINVSPITAALLLATAFIAWMSINR